MRTSQVLVTAVAVLGTTAAVSLPRTGSSTNKALYFLDNNPAGASIVSLAISDCDGTLSDPARTSTGGVGLYGLTSTGAPMTDALFSQDSVTVSGNRLLTVSPGSNTLSLFTIDPTDPAKLTLAGKPVSTGGEFPNSVAFSHALRVACVLNTGSKAGISCFSVNHDNTLTQAGAFFELPSINAAQKTTPPTGPPNTGSDVLFNPSSSALFVTVKGDGATPGYIYAFPVEAGCPVLTKAVVSRPAELMIDFSMSFLSDDRAVISDPTFGAALVDISPSLQVSVSKKVAVPGQKATCWTTFSRRFDAVFLFDGGNPNVTALDPVTGETKYTIMGPAEAKGGFDAAVSGEYLYVLQGAAGISVFDLKGSVNNGKVPRLVQNLDLSGLGSRQGWQGLAVYPS